MNELEILQKKQNQIFVLVCINFLLFMVLFLSIGFVTWKSAVLVSSLQKDLDRAEETIENLRERVEDLDTQVIIDKLVTAATDQLGEAIQTTLHETDLTLPVKEAAEKMTATREAIEETGEAIQDIAKTVKGVDSEEIARMVSYQMLKGLGEGFNEAAESRKPENIRQE